ncbi:MAG TPA: hypothetical protein VHT73_02665 [Thermodesulfobacteriota bacterium]|nr:hypothetical protein [Thermodesulfobacteriota bacterium]
MGNGRLAHRNHLSQVVHARLAVAEGAWIIFMRAGEARISKDRTSSALGGRFRPHRRKRRAFEAYPIWTQSVAWLWLRNTKMHTPRITSIE